jgi:hypothetical protein
VLKLWGPEGCSQGFRGSMSCKEAAGVGADAAESPLVVGFR